MNPKVLVVNEAERWLWVPGHEGRYDVSSFGRVRSYYVYRRRALLNEPAWVMPGERHTEGYVCFRFWQDGRLTRYFGHSLVLEVFVGPRPSLAHVARHLNGCRTDNRVENLAWGTQQENAHDQVVYANRISHSQRLTFAQVREIRERLKAGERGIGKHYGVNSAVISSIKHRRHWGWLA